MIFNLLFVFCICVVSAIAQDDIFGFNVQDSNGNDVSLSKYKDKKAIIIVNVASFCGYTYSNYAGLIELYKQYKDYGLEILAFPSNQFGEQEPKPDSEIQQFCNNYGVTFPVFKKVNVNGPEAIPLYKYLKSKAGKTEIQWNFNKFMVVNGKPIYRYGSNINPADIEEDLMYHLGLDNDGAEGESSEM
jgi:glutathione peroxidase